MSVLSLPLLIFSVIVVPGQANSADPFSLKWLPTNQTTLAGQLDKTNVVVLVDSNDTQIVCQFEHYGKSIIGSITPTNSTCTGTDLDTPSEPIKSLPTFSLLTNPHHLPIKWAQALPTTFSHAVILPRDAFNTKFQDEEDENILARYRLLGTDIQLSLLTRMAMPALRQLEQLPQAAEMLKQMNLTMEILIV